MALSFLFTGANEICGASFQVQARPAMGAMVHDPNILRWQEIKCAIASDQEVMTHFIFMTRDNSNPRKPLQQNGFQKK